MSKIKTASTKAPNEAAEDLSAAVQVLKGGDVIVFPTETLYGLGADALDDAAVEKVFQLKGRDPHNPIPVLVADHLVLPGKKNIPKPLCNSSGEVGVRISSQPLAALLIKGLGRPLTATSANPSGKEPARTLHEAKTYFAGQVEVFVDGGTLTSKSGSTVVEVMEDGIKIIREGEISTSELRRVLGVEKVFL